MLKWKRWFILVISIFVFSQGCIPNNILIDPIIIDNMILIENEFWLDKTEVTIGDYIKFQDETGYLYPTNCTAIGNSGHSLRQDYGIISIYLKGVSDGETKTKKLHLRV